MSVTFGVAALVMVMGAAGFWLMAASPEPAPPEPTVAVMPAQSEPAMPPGPRTSDSIAPEREPESAELTQPPTAANDKAKRMARNLEREQIWAALGQAHGLKPAAPGSAAPSESAAALLPTLDKDYIRETMKEQLVPVALECFNSVLREDPKLAGTLVLNFTIVGSEDVGGIVEESEIGEESTITSPFLQECLRESMLAVTFDPPPNGGRIEISYPITFEPDDGEDE